MNEFIHWTGLILQTLLHIALEELWRPLPKIVQKWSGYGLTNLTGPVRAHQFQLEQFKGREKRNNMVYKHMHFRPYPFCFDHTHLYSFFGNSNQWSVKWLTSGVHYYHVRMRKG